MTTARRLEVLEAEIRRVRRANHAIIWLAAVAGISLLCIVLQGAGPASQAQDDGDGGTVLRANRLIIEDEAGSARIILSASGSTVYDAQGKPRISYRIIDETDAVGFSLVDADGNARVLLLGDKEGAQVTISDASGDTGARLSATDAGTTLSILDRNEVTRATLSTVSDWAKLGLFDADGKQRVSVAQTPDGAMLSLSDADEQAMAFLGGSREGPSLILSDDKGTGRVQMSVNRLGPLLFIYDENEKVIWSAGDR